MKENRFFYYFIFASLALVAASSYILPKQIGYEGFIIEDMQFLTAIYGMIYAFLMMKNDKNFRKKIGFLACIILFFLIAFREVSYFKDFFDDPKKILFWHLSYLKIAHIFVGICIVVFLFCVFYSRIYMLAFSKPFLIDEFFIMVVAFLLKQMGEEWHFYPDRKGQIIEEFSEMILYMMLVRIFIKYARRGWDTTKKIKIKRFYF